MNMNPVQGPAAFQNSAPVGPQKAARAPAPQTPPGAASDSVEFSDDARRLAEGAPDAGAQSGAQASSEQRIAAARQKLLSGQLSAPAVYDQTAAKLLNSGDLGQVQENDGEPAAGG
jgi:hypothetical protein